MKIVCAASVLHAREAFAGLGDVALVPDREISHAHLQDADALVVRSKTLVGPELLEGTPVGFVATATAGADHFDVSWLNRAGIAWTASPGCNANSVAEYVATALVLLARKRAALLPGRTLGIVGVGQVGSRVAQKAGLLGLRVLRNDPPLALKTGSADFRPLDAVLAEAD
ncbi:MAG TPA: NAD(P)-dependent oxidoreductase, partial [Kiritimatiellia bacterium]|nr:NAD(P)-dependent oxidoreductase [Kiritimatiellia bacterium]